MTRRLTDVIWRGFTDESYLCVYTVLVRLTTFLSREPLVGREAEGRRGIVSTPCGSVATRVWKKRCVKRYGLNRKLNGKAFKRKKER